MRPVVLPVLSYQAAVANNLALPQTVAAGFSVVFNGALGSGTNVELSAPTFITITSAGNDSGVTATIIGDTESGIQISENLQLSNGGAATSVRAYDGIFSIIPNVATSSIVVGTLQSGYSDWVPMDIYARNQVNTISVVVTGAINYTVQCTNDNVFDPTFLTGPDVFVFNHSNPVLVNATTSQAASTQILMRAVRLFVNSGSGTAKMTVVQQSMV